MRCPYCGGLNHDQASFCVNCGRGLTRQPDGQFQRQPVPPSQPVRPGAPPQGRPVNAPPAPQTQPRQQNSAPASPRPSGHHEKNHQPQPAAQTGRRSQTGSTPAAPVLVEPEPPVPFPPRSLAQFNALLAAGAQSYTLVESSVGDGKKKLVRIAYARCAGWQQAATLLKALREQQEEQCNTIIIQGIFPQQRDAYAFTNGQLQFAHNVRLGGQISDRYVVETGNGFTNDSTRFVLNE